MKLLIAISLFIIFQPNTCNSQLTMDKKIELTVYEDHIVAPSGSAVRAADQNQFEDYFNLGDQDIILVKETGEPFNGTITLLYENGSLFSNYPFKNGVRDGKYEGFYKSGEPMFTLTYEKGLTQGEQLNYYQGGTIATKALHENGVLSLSTTFHSNGKKQQELSKDNYLVRFDTEGNRLEEGGYDNSFRNRIGTWKYYYSNGNIKEEGNWSQGGRHGKANVKSGVWKIYNENGEQVKTITYDTMGMPISN